MKKRLIFAMIAVVLVVSIGFGAAYAKKQVPSTVEQKTGVTMHTSSKAEIDASNLAEGYISVRYTGSATGRIRVQVIKGETYTYDINNTGTAEILPLTEGDGKYEIKVYEQTSGNKYAVIMTQKLEFKARNELLPFLYPNQFVNYNSQSNCVTLAAKLSEGKTTNIDKLTSIYNFVVGGNFSYDNALAKNVESTYLPNPDDFIVKRSGICFDYASLMVAMLRSQGIPARLVIGYANSASGAVVYHAWIDAYTVETGWLDSVIKFDGENWTLIDPTYISGGQQGSTVLNFVADTSNYTAKLVY